LYSFSSRFEAINESLKRLPTSKTIARSNLGFQCTSVCPRELHW